MSNKAGFKVLPLYAEDHFSMTSWAWLYTEISSPHSEFHSSAENQGMWKVGNQVVVPEIWMGWSCGDGVAPSVL